MKINQLINESQMTCSECGGPAFSDLILAEKQDACYHKVKASAKVWPSAYASGRLVQCRKKGAANYGNKSKNEGVAEATGDQPFDSMMKTIKKGTARQATADRREQRKQSQQQARDAFGTMFGGGNPAAGLGIRKPGVAEGSENKLTPQQKAHERNLDAAQREMDRRHTQGEDMTGAKIDKKTYKIVKPKKEGVAEGSLNEDKGFDVVKSLVSAFNNSVSGDANIPLAAERPSSRVLTRSDGTRYRDHGNIRFYQGYIDPQDVAKYKAAKPVEKFWDWLTSQPGVKPTGQVSGEFRSDEMRDAVTYKGLYFVLTPHGSVIWGSVSRFKNPRSVWRQQGPEQGVAENMYSGTDDTVGFSVNSEAAYQAVMARFGDSIDHDETSGIMYVPERMWPQVEVVAFDADGEGATQADDDVYEDFDPEYDDEAGMADNNLETLRRAVDGIDDVISPGDNLPEWCQEKIAVAKSMLVSVWDYMKSEDQRGDDSDQEDPEIVAMYEAMEDLVQEIAAREKSDVELVWESFESLSDHMLYETAAWKRKEGKSKKGGLNAKGVASYRRENPGSKLQTAVTTKPSKLKKGSKAAKRRKSFCARMSGVKGPMKKPNGKPTRKALALRKWNC